MERRKGDETPSSHDKRHLGTIGSLGRWKKKEINAACCRGHGDHPPYGDRVEKSEWWSHGQLEAGDGLHRRSGERGGRTSKRNGLLASWQGLFSPTHPYPKPVCGRQYLGRAGAAGRKMGATWGCHLGSAHPPSPGTAHAREGRSAATTPKDVVGSDWSTRRQDRQTVTDRRGPHGQTTAMLALAIVAVTARGRGPDGCHCHPPPTIASHRGFKVLGQRNAGPLSVGSQARGGPHKVKASSSRSDAHTSRTGDSASAQTGGIACSAGPGSP